MEIELKRISKSSFKEHCYWKRYLWVVWYWQWHFCNISTQDLEIDQIVLNTQEKDNTEKEESIEEKISNTRYVELIKILIKWMKEICGWISHYGCYKIQELFLKPKSNFKQMKTQEMFKKKN